METCIINEHRKISRHARDPLKNKGRREELTNQSAVTSGDNNLTNNSSGKIKFRLRNAYKSSSSIQNCDLVRL